MTLEDLLGEAGFSPASRQEWTALAARALGGKGVEEALSARTDDGILIEPIHERGGGGSLLPRRRPEMPWRVVQRIDDPDPERANRQALEDLDGGATGIALVFEGAPNAFGFGLPGTEEALARVLAGIPLERAHLRIDPHPSSRAMADWLVAVLSRLKLEPASLSISFGIDPAAVFAGTGQLRMSIDALQASMPPSLAHFFAMGVPGVLLEADGRVFHNAGATEAQELGAMLADAVGHLRLFEEARQALHYASPHIGFAISADQDKFLTIAKIRALRRLWARVQEACSIPPSAASIHAETSYRMMTYGDAETNILRNAVAAFAAAVGGADTISVLPHTIAHGLPDFFARRIARNTQTIMLAESHLDFVADPASGSASVEALTSSLCEAGWAEFQAIEKEGGSLRSLAAGHLQRRIMAKRDERMRHYREGSRDIVGTTIYPPPSERPVSTLAAERRSVIAEAAESCLSLEPLRLDRAGGAAS
jgi:methylmalonyl-CoA mutase